MAGPTGATGATGPAGSGVPVGGATGQVLAKNSATDYDTLWSSLMKWVPYTGTGQSFLAQQLTRDGDWTMVAKTATTTRPAPQPSAAEIDLLPPWTPVDNDNRASYTLYNEWTLSQAGWISQYGVDVFAANAGMTHVITLQINGVTRDTFTAVPNNAGIYLHDIQPIVVASGAVIRATLQVTQTGSNRVHWYQQAALFATAPTYCSLAVGSKDGSAAGTTAYCCHLTFTPGTVSPDWDIVAFGGSAAPSTGPGGGIPDAPSDGNQYGRQNSTWTVIASGGGGQIGGRLSASSGVPVLTSSVSNGTSIFWSPYLGNLMPLWNGSQFSYTAIANPLSNVLANSSVGNAGPAVVVASTTYDLFVWNNAGTPTLTRGPAWANSTPGSGSRGTGAGTSEILMVNGILTNRYAITNGPAAGYGTYVGSFTADGSAGLTYAPVFTQAAGGYNVNISIWNMYNRVEVAPSTSDATASWTYASTTYRMQNNSAGNRISFTVGLVEDMFFAHKEQMGSISGSVGPNVTFGLNSTTARATGASMARNNNTAGAIMSAALVAYPALGANYLQVLEAAESNATATFYGQGTWWQDLTMMRWRA